MYKYFNENILEVGIDEVARGCLFGRVYSSAVIWRNENELDDLLYFFNKEKLDIKDSKKLKPLERKKLKTYIEEYSLDYSVSWCCEKTIDKHNIQNTTFIAMHKALDNLIIKPDLILVDGNSFIKYKDIEHKCIIKGDSKITSISAASILAKVYHDNYIEELVKNDKSLLKYDLLNNMGYGTKKHLEAIKKYGISKYHRKTFGICKNFN